MLFGLLLSLNSFASTSAALTPELILKNPLAMTITQTLVSPEKDASSRDSVRVLPSRDKVFLFEDFAKLKFTYRLQKNKNAPLIFIIPGTGGTAEASGALYLAEQLHKLGYHAITLDNAFSWTFTVAASRSSLPGYTPHDAEDLYKAMQKISQTLVEKEDLNPLSYSLLGYSLGGLQGVFLHRLDQKERKFNFQKVLVVNPPLNLMHAASQLDQMYHVGDSLTRGRKLTVFNRVLEVGGKYIHSGKNFSDPRLLASAFEELNFNNKDLAYLIAGSFRDNLRDVIFASQQVHDLKILKSPVSRYNRDQRYDEARTFGFTQYIKQFVLPQVQKEKAISLDIAALNEGASMYQLGDYIQNHKNLFLIHSSDDFILKEGDIAWIQEKFKDRALIFPIGGHCGLMNFPEFTQRIKEIF